MKDLPTRQPESGALRLFLVDEKTGNPVAHVTVNVFADSPRDSASPKDANSSRNLKRQIATLQTDLAGYVSLKFDRTTVASSSRLMVTHGGSTKDALVLNVVDVLAGNETYSIHFDASALATDRAQIGLPSIIGEVDAEDAILSPGSIGLSHRMGLCDQLMPTSMSARRFEAIQVEANICHPELLSCGDSEVRYVKGEMLEYEIVWYPWGTALGNLLNTFTLAPCEQVNVAVVDWMRREIAVQTSATDTQQQSWQQIDHDRLIAETMQSSVKNKSAAWGVAGSISFPIPKLDLTAAFSGGYSSSTSTQSVALNTTSQLSDHIAQSASSIASTRSTIVFQTTATERQTLQTRTVRNYNHCHMLNLMYYEVTRNYRVVTYYKGKRDVILVKYKIEDFDAPRAYCNAELLKNALLDTSLISCFDELVEALFCCELTPPAPPTHQEVLMDSLTITVKPKEVIFGTYSIHIHLYSATSQIPISSVNEILNPHWTAGGVHTQTINLPSPIDPAQVAWMDIFILSGGQQPAQVILNEIEITYHVVGNGNLILYSSQTQLSISPRWQSPVSPQLPGQQPAAGATKNDCVEKSCCIQKLLGHLNCHKRYYNSILWLNEDPNERVTRWSCCSAGDLPFSLIDHIKNDPITVYGDFLVFSAGPLVPESDVLPVAKLVTMPTPGVYAEGILGKCNTCEKIEPEVFRDWKDSPCPDNAPAIPPPSDPKDTVKPGDLKADGITNMINLTAVPDAPETLLKDLISSLVEKAEGGNSTAKDLLDKLLDGLKESLSKSSG